MLNLLVLRSDNKIFRCLSSLLLFILILTPKVNLVTSHSSLSDPLPISYVNACRVGNGAYCPGPCPRKNFRHDRPVKVIRRGMTLTVRTRKNNHFGGFARWSIVKVKDMWKKHMHNRGAFLYTCHDLRLSRCTYKNRFFCLNDRTNQFYSHKIKIPEIYADGDYVLGFVWYGGIFSSKTQGSFGDYYDCAYVRVQGGPKKFNHWPKWQAGPTASGKNGFCKATVNKIGACWKEPCKVNGRNRPAQYLKPAEFLNGKQPKKLLSSDYK